MTAAKPRVGEKIEEVSFAKVGGGDAITIGQAKDRWTMLFVYRGRHCPRCKKFLNKLNAVLTSWTDVMDVVVVSGDPQDKAVAGLEEFGWDFDLGYGMTLPQMRSLGLYVTDPLSDAEATH